MTYCHWWIHRSSTLLTHWYIGVANVRPDDVLERPFHSSGTFYSAESKLVLISKYIKTIDQVFRGNKNNNHKSHTYRFFDSIIFNTFVQSKWWKLSLISWNLADMMFMLKNNEHLEWLNVFHFSHSVATKGATLACSSPYDFDLIYTKVIWGRRGCDRMEDEFTAICEIIVYIH